MFTPLSKCPPSFSATLIGSVNSMSFKAPIIIASPGGLLGTESGRFSCLRSELHPQTEARYSPCVNAYHVGDFYESPRYVISSGNPRSEEAIDYALTTTTKTERFEGRVTDAEMPV
ncbi:hypothetical protein F2Q68_00006426 [Brassica cretica]|uniref:Uncharacterized protein n=1 Tax=Brassica cretica TaxID=69181 RepID=A0A8S9JKN5_BRACR|nr:hypothetical protein F2Q68_00006426 [Brassica cretica]